MPQAARAGGYVIIRVLATVERVARTFTSLSLGVALRKVEHLVERGTLSSVLNSVPVDAECLGVIQYLNNREL